jgi:hypothetical protein
MKNPFKNENFTYAFWGVFIGGIICFFGIKGVLEIGRFIAGMEREPRHSDLIQACDLRGCILQCAEKSSWSGEANCVDLCQKEIEFLCKKQ